MLPTKRERNGQPPHRADKPLGLQRSPHAPAPAPAPHGGGPRPYPTHPPARRAWPRTRGSGRAPPAAPLRPRGIPVPRRAPRWGEKRGPERWPCSRGTPRAGKQRGAAPGEGGAEERALPPHAQAAPREVSSTWRRGRGCRGAAVSRGRPPVPFPSRGGREGGQAGWMRPELGQVRAQPPEREGAAPPSPALLGGRRSGLRRGAPEAALPAPVPASGGGSGAGRCPREGCGAQRGALRRYRGCRGSVRPWAAAGVVRERV